MTDGRVDLVEHVLEALEPHGEQLEQALAFCGAEIAPMGTHADEQRLRTWMEAMAAHAKDHPDVVSHMLDFALTGHTVAQAAEDWAQLHPGLPRLDAPA